MMHTSHTMGKVGIDGGFCTKMCAGLHAEYDIKSPQSMDEC